MWWINRFGSVSGPYSDEQVERGIKQLKFTKLHKISSDRQNWRRICDTEFWKPVSAAPEEMEIPTSLGLKSAAAPITYGGDEQVAPPTQPGSAKKSSVADFVWRHKIGIAIGTGTVAASLIVPLLLLAVFSGKDGGRSRGPDFESIKKKIVLIRGKDGGSGTGFLVKMDGKKYVMTNDHVARGAELPEMVLVDGTKITPGAMSTASDRDLVRFETDYKGDYFEFSERIPNNNDEIWIYGNSMGDGVVTSIRGLVAGVGDRVVKIEAEFVRGNSGSPIMGTDGKVVAVAAYGRRADEGKDWATKDTSFDSVRRFGIRPVGVNWIDIDKHQYERQSAKLELVNTYLMFLQQYTKIESVSEETLGNLKLVHKDIDKDALPGDDVGFHEMLMTLSKSCIGALTSMFKWKSLVKDRSEFAARLTNDGNDNALADWDATHNFVSTRENVKAMYCNFFSKRKEALLLAKQFMNGINWCSPLMRHGYQDYFQPPFVDYFMNCIDNWLAQNAQTLIDFSE